MAKLGCYFEIQDIAERPYPILHLVFKSQASPYKFAHYFKDIEENISKIEAAWEVRISDMSLDNPQFRVLVGFAKTKSFTYVCIGKNHLQILDNNKLAKIPFNAGNNFKSFILKADANANTFSLYEDNNPKVLYSGKLTPDKNMINKINFGDGSGLIHGEVDLSYFGCNIE